MATMEMEVKQDSNIETNGQDSNNQTDHTLQWAEYYDNQAISAENEGRMEEANLAKQWAEYYRSQITELKPSKDGNKTISKSTDTSDATNCGTQDTSPPEKAEEELASTAKEIKTYWAKVKSDFKDFNSWTYLLQLIENENKVEEIKNGMDSFLTHYPYCYGYWKKYADLIKNHEGADEVEKIFEKGVKAIPLSVDLWIHYLEWTIKHRFKDRNSKNDDDIRNLFLRAIDTCGLEFKSDRLWQMALDWESQKRNLRNVLSLYDKLIAIPTHQYTAHYLSLVEIIQGSEPVDILPEEDYINFKREIQEERREAVKMAKSATPNEDAMIAANLIPATAADTLGKCTENSMDPHDLPLLAEEENRLIKDKMLSLRQPIHEATTIEVNKRWNFEESIKRPYFHVKPIERSQLRNWHEYLDYETKQENHTRIVFLYERCLISCALYEEFWLKYAKYMTDHSHIEEARSIYERACNVHLPMKVNLALSWSHFEENISGMESAIKILDQFEARHPGIIAVIVHRVGVLRRYNKLEECDKLYHSAVESSVNSKVKIFWAEKYARFCYKILNNLDKAKAVLENVRRVESSNYKLTQFIINLLYTAQDFENLFKFFDDCINSSTFTVKERLDFSQSRLDFLDDLSSDVKQIEEAKLAHSLLKDEERNNKRKPDDYSGDTSSKRKKTDQDWYNNYSAQQWYGQQWMNYGNGNGFSTK
ncbi:DgyrCDS7672 [Dimorphilus gyrociliatus]|uniref:DgyrCDS7672 n=1 Tax=Dimorphilus gyrociliatus TaxID=2664684 RepID=A0A7I8VRT1_9ANNE|nr:DgyrCDS7672 [Dimorphilus gyrociliatus]